MKIAYLSSSPIDKMPANAVHVMNMCASLSEIGHSVSLHAKSDFDLDSNSYMEKYGCKNTFGLSLKSGAGFGRLAPVVYALRQVSALKESNDATLCYARCPFSAYFALLSGYKVIFEAHEVPHSKILSFVYRRIFKHRDLVRLVVISKALKDDLFNFGFTLKESVNIVVAHDGANLLEAPSSSHVDEIFKWRKKKLVVGYAGGLRSGNGIRLILRLAVEFPNIDFKIVGGKADEITTWKDFENPVNVHWIGSVLPKEVYSFLLQCDILLAPYQHGPKTGSGRDTSRWMSPLKIFEYMAAGKAMIVSDYPVLREVLEEENAILVDPDDFQGWIMAINKLSADDGFRDYLGSRALQNLKDKYTWIKRAEKVIAGVTL